MSRQSFRFGLNQQKYSLKFIIYLFLLLDLVLFFNFPFAIFRKVLEWEVVLLIGLFLGIRGQARYKQLVMDLFTIRKDPQYDKDEDLRGHALKRLIDHASMEYDIWFSKTQLQSTK